MAAETQTALESAVEKMSAVELTYAEFEALVTAIRAEDGEETVGFGARAQGLINWEHVGKLGATTVPPVYETATSSYRVETVPH